MVSYDDNASAFFALAVLGPYAFFGFLYALITAIKFVLSKPPLPQVCRPPCVCVSRVQRVRAHTCARCPRIAAVMLHSECACVSVRLRGRDALRCATRRCPDSRVSTSGGCHGPCTGCVQEAGEADRRGTHCCQVLEAVVHCDVHGEPRSCRHRGVRRLELVGSVGDDGLGGGIRPVQRTSPGVSLRLLHENACGCLAPMWRWPWR
jgi:hypothetical protein